MNQKTKTTGKTEADGKTSKMTGTMRTEKEVRVTLEAWRENPEVEYQEYKDNPGKLLVEILEWVVGDK